VRIQRARKGAGDRAADDEGDRFGTVIISRNLLSGFAKCVARICACRMHISTLMANGTGKNEPYSEVLPTRPRPSH